MKSLSVLAICKAVTVIFSAVLVVVSVVNYLSDKQSIDLILGMCSIVTAVAVLMPGKGIRRAAGVWWAIVAIAGAAAGFILTEPSPFYPLAATAFFFGTPYVAILFIPEICG